MDARPAFSLYTEQVPPADCSRCHLTNLLECHTSPRQRGHARTTLPLPQMFRLLHPPLRFCQQVTRGDFPGTVWPLFPILEWVG